MGRSTSRPPNRGGREALRCDQSERAPPTKSLIQLNMKESKSWRMGNRMSGGSGTEDICHLLEAKTNSKEGIFHLRVLKEGEKLD